MWSKRDQRRRRQRAEGRLGARSNARKLADDRHLERAERGEVPSRSASSGRVEGYIMHLRRRRAFEDAEREAKLPLDPESAN